MVVDEILYGKVRVLCDGDLDLVMEWRELRLHHDNANERYGDTERDAGRALSTASAKAGVAAAGGLSQRMRRRAASVCRARVTLSRLLNADRATP
jgi:hypothetical protein